MQSQWGLSCTGKHKKYTNKQTPSVMSKQKRIMAKGKVMDIKREAKSEKKGFVRISDHSDQPNVQTPDNDLQTTDNLDDVQKNISQRKNLKKGEEVDVVFGFRQTVIRNLPQLQKLDNVPVSSEEMVSILKMMVKIMLKLVWMMVVAC